MLPIRLRTEEGGTYRRSDVIVPPAIPYRHSRWHRQPGYNSLRRRPRSTRQSSCPGTAEVRLIGSKPAPDRRGPVRCSFATPMERRCCGCRTRRFCSATDKRLRLAATVAHSAHPPQTAARVQRFTRMSVQRFPVTRQRQLLLFRRQPLPLQQVRCGQSNPPPCGSRQA